MEGRIEGLWIKRAARGPMDAAGVIELVEDRGVRGSADQGGWRQVTVIEREVFDAVAREMGREIDPAVRRANVMISGVRLEKARGRILHLGDCRIHLRGETVPCERMDEAVDGLRAALKPGWRGGVFGKIVAGGTVRVGDPVRLGDEVALL